ncbi:MAG: metal-dependent transcriptional regulator [Candidatus Thermoplasmatota archaeon]|nr:metal-dependent transcriptional regulator [Candidatus Thermoplasmatota archaeon]
MVGHFQEFEDEYLETMYEFHEESPGAMVKTGDLAKRLRVSPASATEMVQRLSKRGFVSYTPYKGVMLTDEGLEHGRRMKRRHRLAEVMLERLPFDGNAHATACRLEHAIDDDLEVALSRWLGHPTTDPSGRPIPPATGQVAERLAVHAPPTHRLAEDLAEGEGGMIVAVTASSALESLGLALGARLERTADGISVNGAQVQLSEALLSSMVVDVSA